MQPHDRTHWQFVLVDSLEKVFPDQDPRPWNPGVPLSVFVGETASFQVAFRPPFTRNFGGLGAVWFKVSASPGVRVRTSAVDLVPVEMPAFEDHDDGYLRDQAGLFPDLLTPTRAGIVTPLIGQWKAAWFDIRVDELAHAGTHDLLVTAHSTTSESVLFETTVRIEVLPAKLPELDLVHTEWVHCDSIADYYGYEVFSEAHWHAIDRFISKAVEMDTNSVLTPTWTPPLDTAVGGTRTPVQLIDVFEQGGEYHFGFRKLERWMQLCANRGIRYLEIAHLFTQWGAKHTPAIYVETSSGIERRFGWHVNATDPEYRRFLEALLPQLRFLLHRRWGLDRVIFHISDEPHGAEMLASYQAAKAVVADLLDGCMVIDALSDFEFYASGAVPVPVVATDHVTPFLEAEVDPLWVYYCVGQNRDVANRYIALPAYRNRVLAHQLYTSRASGFLHWGFNFYNSFHSIRPVDPYRDTCSGGAFPGGDPFIVYPGPDGEPFESIRFRVFAAAMADLRAAQLLERLRGRQAVLDIIDPDGALTYDRYSRDPDFYLGARERINQAIGVALREPVS